MSDRLHFNSGPPNVTGLLLRAPHQTGKSAVPTSHLHKGGTGFIASVVLDKVGTGTTNLLALIQLRIVTGFPVSFHSYHLLITS